MKIFAILTVSIAMIFFLVGGALCWQGIFPVESYAITAGIVGSLASTVGLLGFAAPRLTSNDFQIVESELLEKLAEATKELNEYQSKISGDKEQIAQLQQDKREIEFLVRQASFKIFLEEKIRNLSYEIEQKILSDQILSEYLIQYSKTKNQIIKLEGEIAASEKAELIYEIVGKIKPDNRRIYIEFFGIKLDASPFLRGMDLLASTIIGRLHLGKR